MDILLSYGHIFCESTKLHNFAQSLGYRDFWDINARIDERIIDFIRKNLVKIEIDIPKREIPDEYFYTDKTNCGTGILRIVKVDITKPWIIDEYDNSECVRYLTLVNEKLNYYKI